MPHVIAQLGWYSHDSDPILDGTWEAATAAVDVALSAWRAVAEADAGAPRAYGLCRPPGHHAAADSFAGYCYLNNAAIAAQAWVDRGARVAILDVDFHHGNGTQQIFYDRDDVLFVSLHADPADDYPFFLGFASERGWGAGEGYTRNFPLPPGTEWARVRARARRRGRSGARSSRPTGSSCRSASTPRPRIRTRSTSSATTSRASAPRSARSRLPTVVVQEGGYALAVLGRNVVNVLRAVGD